MTTSSSFLHLSFLHPPLAKVASSASPHFPLFSALRKPDGISRDFPTLTG
jgi:hypothetical protein